MIDKRDLGQKIRGFRLIRDVSLDQLSDKTGIKPATLASYELGKRTPSGSRLLEIMVALDVNAYDLTGRGRS